MKLSEALKRLGDVPVGLTSAIAAPASISGGHEQSTMAATSDDTPEGVRRGRAFVLLRLDHLTKAMKECKSDAAYWGLASQQSFWRAVDNLLAAAEIVGPLDMPDVEGPKPAGVLMDMMAEQERYGERMLKAAKSVEQAAKAHPEAKVGTKQIEPTMEDIKKGGTAAIDLIKALQEGGMEQDMAIATVLFGIGSAMASCGILLQRDVPLGDALPPLMSGYEKARKIVVAMKAVQGGSKGQQ